MPELPEVETVRRQLHEQLKGATIREIRVFRTGRERPVGAAFVLALVGSVIQSIERRAKLLVWRLQDGRAILAHLKMTGKFLCVESSFVPTKHDAMLFVCETSAGKIVRIVWNDVRKFGYMEVASEEKLRETLAEYGPEPLDVAPEVLAECLRLPQSRVLKAALLHQVCIAGIGNIYADEACYRAGIHPTRRLGTLKEEERFQLAKAIQAVLRESLALRGTSAHTYLDTAGAKGGFASSLRVYGREGEPCLTCGESIRKMRLVQRGTHVCERCQR